MGHGSRKTSIARVAPTSLTTKTLRWLHEEGWEEAQTSAFFRRHEAPAVGIYAPPAYVRPRGGISGAAKEVPLGVPVRAGRWLLETCLDGVWSVQATAEAELQCSAFTGISLTVSDFSGGGGWPGASGREALSLLVTALLLLADADTLKLIGFSEAASTELTSLAFGPAQLVYAPLRAPLRWTAAAPFLRLSVPTIVPSTWWQTEVGADARKTLSYLEKRLANNKEAAPAPRRRGFGAFAGLGRLFRR